MSSRTWTTDKSSKRKENHHEKPHPALHWFGGADVWNRFHRPFAAETRVHDTALAAAGIELQTHRRRGGACGEQYRKHRDWLAAVRCGRRGFRDRRPDGEDRRSAVQVG